MNSRNPPKTRSPVAVLTNDVEQRLQAVAEQRTRTDELLDRKAQTIADMLARFGSLMNDGIYNLLFSDGMYDNKAIGRGPAKSP
jgi:hypothetical protein